MVNTRVDDDFWINEAAIENDICDNNLTTMDFLSQIIPEMPKDPKNILEIGCGVGRLTNEIKKRFPDAVVAGIDINPDFLSEAEVRSGYKADIANPSKYPFYYCRDNIIEIPKQDFIYSVLVFQHLNNESKTEYIRQIGQALRIDGVSMFQYVEGAHSSRAMYDADIKDVRQWCEQAGLTIINEQFDLICPRWTWITVVKR